MAKIAAVLNTGGQMSPNYQNLFNKHEHAQRNKCFMVYIH